MAEPNTAPPVDRVHGTAIAVDGDAVLIRGPSGAGKSDLALRCLAIPVGPFASARPRLVADDQVEILARGGVLEARAPATIAGLIEVRGIGIVAMPAVSVARLVLIADLARSVDIERMPEPSRTIEVCGISVHHILIDPSEPSAPLKLLLALAGAVTAGSRV